VNATRPSSRAHETALPGPTFTWACFSARVEILGRDRGRQFEVHHAFEPRNAHQNAAPISSRE
jgi:hypothetical protein